MISVIPVEGLPDVEAGADLGALIATAAELEDDDVVVVAQKVVSKAEGRVVALADVEPSERALELAVDAAISAPRSAPASTSGRPSTGMTEITGRR